MTTPTPDPGHWYFLEAIKRENLPDMPAAVAEVLGRWHSGRNAVLPHCTDEQRAASHGVGLFLGMLAERGYYVERSPLDGGDSS